MILLLGYGISNQSISKYLDNSLRDYIIYDDKLSKINISFNDIDLIIKSGSISNNHFVILEAKKRNIEIISDLEFFYREYDKCRRIIAVTGTNGKSTTVSLIKNIIGKNIELGGNIGIPLFDFIKGKKDLIIETSSYMNEYLQSFHAKYYVITNIYPNHLEHHNSYTNYIKAKLNFLKNIQKNDYLIYNYDNEILRRICQNIECYKIPFSRKEKVKGAYLENGKIYFNMRKIMNVCDINLEGEHNIENVLASVAVCYCYDIAIEQIEQGVKSFKGIEHRLERFLSINNINVYNDSKSTNFLAMKSAISSLKENKILLICGGEKKSDNVNVLDDNLSKVKKVIVCGENKDFLTNYFVSKNIIVDTYDTLEEAIKHKNEFFKEDIDTILFSPGSPSFDQFKNFEDRGRFFKKNML